MSNYIYQMCTFLKFTSVENNFIADYKFDSFYTSREKAIVGTKDYIKYLAEKYKGKVTECLIDDECELYSILALVEYNGKKEYYGYKRHHVNI